MRLSVVFALVVCATLAASAVALKEGECEVCIKVVNDFIKEAEAAKKLSDAEHIHSIIRKYCKATKDLKAERFCWYIGGKETSATAILPMVSGPMSRFMPAEKVCEKLKKSDAAICELRYTKKSGDSSEPVVEEVREETKVVDVGTVDLNTLKVKDLKKVLSSWNEQCVGCTSKDDFIARIKDLKGKHNQKVEL